MTSSLLASISSQVGPARIVRTDPLTVYIETKGDGDTVSEKVSEILDTVDLVVDSWQTWERGIVVTFRAYTDEDSSM